jgi:hypothetical protein
MLPSPTGSLRKASMRFFLNCLLTCFFLSRAAFC